MVGVRDGTCWTEAEEIGGPMTAPIAKAEAAFLRAAWRWWLVDHETSTERQWFHAMHVLCEAGHELRALRKARTAGKREYNASHLVGAKEQIGSELIRLWQEGGRAHAETRAALAASQAICQTLREALEFYADQKLYENDAGEYDRGGACRAEYDGGERARDALRKAGG